MSEDQIRSIVSSMLSSYSNSVVPWHVHNGSDSPRIPPTNLLPYTVSTGSGTNVLPSGKTNTTDGTIQFYDVGNAFVSVADSSPLTDWGFNIGLGGIWNPMTLVPSGVAANLSIAQTFADSTPTIVIADNVFYDLYPTAPNPPPSTQLTEYDKTDGTFTCATAGNYMVNCGLNFDNSGGANGFVILTAIRETNATPIKVFQKYVDMQAADLIFSIDISGIMQAQRNDLIYFQIEQTTGGNLTTLTDENTWLNIQKMK